MTFVSYAQNFEDVILWRALRHIPDGFYVDVGAMSPEQDSVTHAFYQRGWRGINVEPLPEHYAELVESRERDINLCVAVSEREATRDMFFVNSPGLSTLDKDIARQHVDQGMDVYAAEVQTTTLAHILRKYLPDNQTIHFLKIDVEGLEAQVLQSNDWSLFRPWILIVEAVSPVSGENTSLEWEQDLISESYTLVYKDGLNRFYLADECAQLSEAFSLPPNVFDDFESSKLVQAREDCRQAQLSARQAKSKYSEAVALSAEAGRKVERAERKLDALEASLSWRITGPLRKTLDILVGAYDYLATSVNHSMAWVLNRFIEYSARNPLFKPRLMKTLRISPEMEQRVIRFAIVHELIGGTKDLVRSGPTADSQGSFAKKVTDADYFDSDVTTKIAGEYGLSYDAPLVRKARTEKNLCYDSPDKSEIERNIVYVSLALLGKYPSPQQVSAYSRQIRKSQSYEPLFNAILNSAEFGIRGYKKIS